MRPEATRSRIKALGPHRRALLESRLSREYSAQGKERSIERREKEAPARLSYSQQRFWFLSRLEPTNTAYNIIFAVSLRGSLEEEALESSLTEILRRHEALRTNFTHTDGVPRQIIRTVERVRLDRYEAKGDTPAFIQNLVDRDMSHLFNLAKDLLLRCTLVKTGDTEHILLILTHHIVFDGWSKEVFIGELESIYEDFISGREPALQELLIQYADFSEWQRRRMDSGALDEEISYWKEKLAGHLPRLELSMSRPRPPVQTYRGASHSVPVDPELVEKLKALGLKVGATLFMTLTAVFQALLYRYTGEEDIVIGTEIAGRTQVETEKLLGFFVNILVLRTGLSGDPAFTELLRRVRKVTLEAFEHQELSFDRLVSELNPERDMSRPPLFQVSIQLKNVPRRIRRQSGLKIEEYRLLNKVVMFDLMLDILMEEEGGFTCKFEYNTDLFDAPAIERMAAHFLELLRGVVEDPETRVSGLPLLGASERSEILNDWSGVKTDYPADRCIQELFEEQVLRDPDAVALASGGVELSYGELNRRANRLAHHITARGAGPGVRVGLCMERSMEAVIAMLGIIKAGGAYVPLDPDYPSIRLEFMLRETGAQVLVTTNGLKERVPGYAGAVVRLDIDGPAIARESDENPECLNGPEDLSYVIYTSGSTGTPKGVCVVHRAVARLVKETDYVDLGPGDTVAQASSLSFDAATFELWGALLNGARLDMIDKDLLLSPKEFEIWVKTRGISVMFLTTALFNRLAEAVPRAFSTLRSLFVGGEALDPRWVEKVLREGPPQSFSNVYGPTENTTFSTCHTIKGLPLGGRSVPIGRPIANTSVYVLDKHLNPVPVGIAGELNLGGDGLAAGYMNDPELTAEKFIPNPFDKVQGSRLYRTGDLVRWLPDGTIDFIGRLDGQVKIRGFRVETGEIEAALKVVPGIKDAVVVLREDVPGEKRLVAYPVPHDGVAVDESALREGLGNRLPSFMVPAHFVPLEGLPLNSSGKVDRGALPAPGARRTETEKARTAACDETEKRLKAIWEEVLCLQGVGMRESFFDLGGDSLLAVRLWARIEDEFGIRLTVSALFNAQTIEELARLLRDKRDAQASPSLVPLKPDGVNPPFFCVHAGHGNVLTFKDLVRHMDPDQPFYGIQSQGLDGRRAPYERIEDMAAHYIREIRTVQPRGPYFLGGRCFGGLVALEMANQLRGEGDEVALLVMFDVQFKPMDAWGMNRPDAQNSFISTLKNLQYQMRHGQLVAFLKMKAGRRLNRVLQRFKPMTSLERRLKEVKAANNRARKSYEPTPYPGRITFFVTATHTLNPKWKELAAGGLEWHVLPGNHRTLFKEPKVKAVASLLKRCIDEVLMERKAGRKVRAAAQGDYADGR